MSENVSNNPHINKINSFSNKEIQKSGVENEGLPSVFGFNDTEEEENINSPQFLNKEEVVEPESREEQAKNLQEQLSKVKDEQGWLSNAWNGLKSSTGIGSSTDKCEQAIEKFKNGELSYDEALNEISEFSSSQKESVNLVSNVISGVTAVGTAVAATAVIAASGGTAAPLVLIAIGTGAGAVTKAGLKFSDRATNNIDGDALNGKQILKDGLSGAVDGAASVATMGIGTAGVVAGASTKSVIINGVKSGAEAGSISGAMTGAGDYTIEAAIEEDAKFDTDEFVKTTFTNALAGALTGGVIGGAASGIKGKTLANTTEDTTQRTLTSEMEEKRVFDFKIPKNALKKNDEALKSDLNIVERGEIPESANIKTSAKQGKSIDFERAKKVQEAKEKGIAKFAKTKEELTLSAHNMNQNFENHIKEATQQIRDEFGILHTSSRITGRAKSEDSILKKLIRKFDKNGFKTTDVPSCMNQIGDAYGTRIQMKCIDKKEAKAMIQDCLKGYNVTYSEFCSFVRGDNAGLNAEKKIILDKLKSPIIDLLKERQSQEVVNQLVDGIKQKRITITELNNYGDELSSYFTTKQVQEISDACKEATGKRIPIVNRQKIDEKNGTKVQEDSVESYKSSVDTSKAVKQSGYTSAQMNITHKFKDGTLGNGELQIRGTSVNQLADVEHIPYDIRQGKITEDNKKYKDIYKVIKNMSKSTYRKYNRFLTQTYHSKRLNELGIPAKIPDIKEVFKEGEIPHYAFDLLSVKGLVSISKRE